MGANTYLILIIMLLFVSSCRKDVQSSCANVQSVNAEFTIYETCNNCYHWIDYATDTTVGGWVRFTAALNDAQYEWHIGSGVYTTQSFALNFSGAPDNSIIPVTLIVMKTPDLKCFPNDHNQDTLTQNMVINRNTHLFYGTWQGYYTDTPGVVATVTVVKKYVSFQISNLYDTIPFIYDLKPRIDTFVDPVASDWSYRKYLYFQILTGGVPETIGSALVDSTNNNIQINYYYYGPYTNTTGFIIYNKTFKGKRL